MRSLLVLLLLLPAAPAQALEPLALRLTLVQFAGGKWQEKDIAAAAARAIGILGQCGIAPGGIDVKRIDVGARYRIYETAVSRELARFIHPAAPAIYFVDETHQNPAFDAEAIGRGNSRSRPELRDTVWVVYGARDLDLVLAHELAHVLMDSGEHSEEPGNLMRDETAPGSTRLSEAQCARLREIGARHGLLRPPR